jgi:nitrite reductase/ring-hydroxylating ferredoxin subunit
LADPGARGFEVGDQAVIAVRVGQAVYGWVNSCPHVGVQLDIEPDRFFDFTGHYLLCSYHGAIFLPNTGHCVRGPCRGQGLQPFPLRIDGGMVVVA